MAQKPNFLKKLTSGLLMGASTAALIAGFTGSAMGAANSVALNNPSALGTANDWQQGAGKAAPTNNAASNIYLGGLNNLSFDAAIGNLGTLNLYGFDGKTATATVTLANQLVNVKSTVDAATIAAVTAANNAVAIPQGAAGANAKINFNINAAITMEFGNAGAGDLSALGNITLSDNAAVAKISAANANIQQITANAAGNGVVQVNAANVTFAQAIAGGLGELQILAGNSATLAANAAFDTTGIILGNNTTLTINDGVNLTAANAAKIDSVNANNGVLTFGGSSQVGMSVGSANGLNAINIAAGTVEFKGDPAGLVKATTINLGGANSVMTFTTNNQVITGDIVAATNGQGGIAVNGINLAVTGNIGANGNSLATINFETDKAILIITPGANASALFVQNLNTAAPNTGTLELHGANFAINSNIGGNNALKLVDLADDGAGAPAATNFTLKQNSSINAQNIYLSDAFDNTLTLEEGTTVTGDIINKLAAGNGTIILTGNATINGGIGVDVAAGGNLGKAIKNINLGSNKNLSYGGKSIQIVNAPANGITFAANEILTLTNATDPIAINSNIFVTTDKQGIIDASAVTNNQTLTISGKIGAIVAGANKTLGQLNVGSSKTAFNGGDVAINELVIGNNGSVQLAHNTYLITKTTNAAGQGKIIVAGDNAVPDTTLSDGTNLGSAANPLSEINFGTKAANLDSVLNIGKGVNLYATNITTTDANTGSLSFKAGGTNIVSGTVGGQQGNKFNTVALDNGTTAQFLGNAIFNGATTIEAASTLQIGGNYTADYVESADNTGIVEFVNADDITVTLNKQAGAVNALTQITVSALGNITFNETGNAGNDHGINTNKIAFTEASLGAAIFLPSGIAFDGLTITSTVKNGPAGDFDAPFVVVSGIDSTIANGQSIGDQNNIVGLGLGSDNGITVNATTLYAGIGTTKDNQGTVTLSGGIPNTPGTIYGLGISNGTPKLKQVTFTTDYNNLGSIIATNATINDGLTVTTGGIAGTDFDGKITLGSANGNANVRFVNGTFSDATSMIVTTKANNGTVTYLGSALVGNIGSSDTPVASVKFTGNDNGAGLQGNIYSQVTDFGTYDLSVLTSNVILGGGTTAINGEIDLLTNTLTFASGTSTWGSNTSLTTDLTVSNGNIGHIVIAENAQVNATTTGTTTINVQDSANANFSGTQTYTLIQGGARFNGTLGAPKFDVTGSNIFVKYGLIRADNQDYVLTRTNDATNVVTNAIGSSQFAGAAGIGQNVTAFLNSTNTAAYNNLLLAKNTTDAANFVGAITTDTSAAVTNAQLDVAKDIQAHLGNRVNAVRYLGTPETAEMAGPEAGAVQAPVAAGDEAVDNVAYGMWAKPFYTVADQDKKGGVAGYKAKTTGVVIGLDTLANDNLMIGAAIGITKTDIKHQDYKKGDKTDVNGFSFSLYGAQQLVENFFAQGSAIFSLNQVKNKSQRYFFDANGNMSKQIAAGNYDNMTFGGNLTVGYDYNAMEGVLVTPMAGLSYLKSSDENYKETGTTVANKQVNSKFSDRTDLIVGARVMGGTMNFSDLAVYPEAHAFVVHKVNGRLSKTQSQLDGQVTPFISQPDRTAKTSYNLGLSASIRPDAKMEYGIGYDAQIASKYNAHQGTLKVRVNF